jgi:hypothetical protein
VIVNGAAAIDILGSTADLRSLSGEPLGWEHFACTGVLPPNPDGFSFHKVSGRGKVELIRHPLLDGGGPVTFRIKSSQSSPESFMIEVSWTGLFEPANRSWRPRS